MKFLIVNGDDFGASRGINRGIVEAHLHGVLTSTSLMVDMPAAAEAAALSRDLPDLSVGLHVSFTNEDGDPVVDLDAPEGCRRELHRQLERFRELMGQLPTHLDSHHNIHLDARVWPHFLDAAQSHRLPMRQHSPARHFGDFYGQWDGESHPEHISVENLIRMLENEVRDGFTELGCHPGYVDPEFHSSYSGEREVEVRTLCDPAIRQALAKWQVQLIGFRNLGQLLNGEA